VTPQSLVTIGSHVVVTTACIFVRSCTAPGFIPRV